MRLYVGFIDGTDIELSEREGRWQCRSMVSGQRFGPDRSSVSEAVLDCIAYLVSDGFPSAYSLADALARLIDEIGDRGLSVDGVELAQHLLSRVGSNPRLDDLPYLQRTILRKLRVSAEQCALFRRRTWDEDTLAEYLLVEARPGSLSVDVEYPNAIGAGKLRYCQAPAASVPTNGLTEHRFIREVPQEESPDKIRGYWTQGIVGASESSFPVYGWRDAARAAVDSAVANGASCLVLHGVRDRNMTHYARVKGIELLMGDDVFE